MNSHPPFGPARWPDQLPPRYWLANAQVPTQLLAPALHTGSGSSQTVALLIEQGRIAAIEARAQGDAGVVELGRATVYSAFVDPHTHLDKGDLLAAGLPVQHHLLAAIEAVRADYGHWSRPELTARIDFALRTAYAHGTRALNSYCDWSEPQGPLAWQVLQDMRAQWRNRVALVLTSLANIEDLADAQQAQALGHAVAQGKGVLGFYVPRAPHVAALLPLAFDLAERFDLRLDFHIDEHLDPGLSHLHAVATLALARGWGARTVCGHACVLPLLSPDEQNATLDAAAASGMHLVCLPYTNLYLQDHTPLRTPRLRGLTSVQEARRWGVPIALGSDNHRDVFFPAGDLDPLQTLALAALAAQLDDAALQWADSITLSAARALDLAWDGVLRVGAPADLVVHPGRSSAEVLSRPAQGRQVLRAGQRLSAAEAKAPDFSELDGLRG
jgi:cytosine deaminase